MLAAMKNREKSVVEYLLQSRAHFTNSSTNDEDITDILSLASHVSKRFLQTSLGPFLPRDRGWGVRTRPDRRRNIQIHEAQALEGSEICWRYRIIAAPANAIQDPWIHILIQEGLDFRDQDKSGRFPLHSAAAAGDLRALKVLIMAGVDINACHGGLTAISQAALNGQHEAIRFLHDSGADMVLGRDYSRFFDCILDSETTANFCINLPRFQVNEPCGHTFGELRCCETPIKVLISDYKPRPWVTKMLCEAGAELNDPGITAYPSSSEPAWEGILARLNGLPKRQYKPCQTVLDRALERVEEAKSEEVEEFTEKQVSEEAELRLLMGENDEGTQKYKDPESYNRWLYHRKEYKIWAAEEVVRILEEFGAELGKNLLAHRYSDAQQCMGLKRRRF
ncbi:hypothetical protein DL95DRAFT_396406 [Leptodontidium sp. 2 PMI_412]|nr:hypothetical protein DL95DRAFT_396406 [Leptodontidium sp. 2 PMI_412]